MYIFKSLIVCNEDIKLIEKVYFAQEFQFKCIGIILSEKPPKPCISKLPCSIPLNFSPQKVTLLYPNSPFQDEVFDPAFCLTKLV